MQLSYAFRPFKAPYYSLTVRLNGLTVSGSGSTEFTWHESDLVRTKCPEILCKRMLSVEDDQASIVVVAQLHDHKVLSRELPISLFQRDSVTVDFPQRPGWGMQFVTNQNEGAQASSGRFSGSLTAL
jgi:hypothetical protein